MESAKTCNRKEWKKHAHCIDSPWKEVTNDSELLFHRISKTTILNIDMFVETDTAVSASY